MDLPFLDEGLVTDVQSKSRAGHQPLFFAA
jgi:hypothetical protein